MTKLTIIVILLDKLQKVCHDAPMSTPNMSQEEISKAILEEGKKLLSAKIKVSGPMKIGEISELLGSSRKYVVPLMEHLDRVGFTERDGDYRKIR